jgi:DNA-binding beta-propeller fold protein YncE
MLPELPRLEPRAVDLPMTGALRFLLACLALAMTGCATAPPLSTEPEVQLVFPPPPAVPRYIYERSLYGSKDLDGRAKKSALMTLLDGKNDPQEENGEGLARPQALAVFHGRVFITNSLDSPISVFDIPNKKFFKIGENRPGVLQMPLGLSADRAGNLFVADAKANAILVFGKEGNYLRHIGGPKWFSRLTNVTADPKDNRVYAIDVGDEDHRVRVFDSSDGRHLFDFGRRGHGPGEFNIPYDLAVGKDGRLNVVDSGNFRVQIFDHEGRYLTGFGSAGKQPGQFARPKEIAADAAGNLYVVDGASGNFQVFDPDGAFLFFIGAHGEDGGAAKYMLPSGIDIDEDGRVYFVDQWYGKIEIFRPLHPTLEKENPALGTRAKLSGD